jgi:DNA-binding CsgD family transcriptional regulator
MSRLRVTDRRKKAAPAPRAPAAAGHAPTFASVQSLPASAVILDAAGKIVAVNHAWKEFGRRNGLRMAHDAIGADYLAYCGGEDPHARRFLRELKALLAGRRDLLTLIYPCHSPRERRWFSLIGLPLSLDRPAGVALLHVNLTPMLPHAAAGRGKGLRPAANMDAISGAVERSVSDAIAAQLTTMFAGADGAARAAQETEAEALLGRLSARQREVLRLLGEGKSNKEMARALLLSPNTVKLHVSAVLARLKLKSRTHAALLASRLNRPGEGGSDLSSWKRGRAA